MTTPVFETFQTSCLVDSPLEGTRPVFISKKNIDAKGFEKKEPVKPGEEVKE